MAKRLTSSLFTIVFLSLFNGHKVYAVPYNHRFNPECIAKPEKAHYNGGIVINPELNHGLKGWTTPGGAKIVHQQSEDGNNYIVASDRNSTFDSFTQKIYLEKNKLYVFSAWLRVSRGNGHIAAKFKTKSGDVTAGWVMAQNGCWSMLKGGLVVNSSGPAQLYFENEDTSVHIMADSISLQPFTHEDWKSHQDQGIAKVRKRRVKFQVIDQHGRALANATITIKQNRPHFPLGCTINPLVLKNIAYQKWFLQRFKYTVFENQLKWYVNEPFRRKEDYGPADALLKFAHANNIQGDMESSSGILIGAHSWRPAISTRGDGSAFIFGGQQLPNWVVTLSTHDLQRVTFHRINSILGRYLGQMIHWDVVNENLHYSFFEDKLGPDASTRFFARAHKIDRRTIPFLNEFDTLESGGGGASAAKYLAKIKQIRQEGYKGPLGIGLEGHFTVPNLPYIRASLDQLATAKLPIWITELDVDSRPHQATYLEQILRELHAHEGVKGIMIWGAWTPRGCYRMCLTDNNFKNLPTGDVVDKLLSEWKLVDGFEGITDSNGYLEASLFHGDYEAQIVHPSQTLTSTSKFERFNVTPMFEVDDQNIMHVNLHA